MQAEESPLLQKIQNENKTENQNWETMIKFQKMYLRISFH